MAKISIFWQGALYKLLGCACFSFVNGLIRYTIGGVNNLYENNISFYQIVFLENLMGAMILLPWMLRNGIMRCYTKWPILHFVRILLAVSGMILWYASLKFIPIAQAMALSFTGPILGLIGARVFLKEKINNSCFLAFFFSFIGAFLIIKPYNAFIYDENSSLGFLIFLPILSAASFAGTKILDRILGKKGESSQLLTLYLLIFMAPASFMPACFNWITPSFKLICIIGLMSALSTIAYLSFAKAFKIAPVTFLIPFGFSKLIFSSIIAYFAFEEVPMTLNFWIGIVFIMFSIMFLSLFNKNNIERF